MVARVLERERELAALADAARGAAAGAGCVVLVSGEAGIGKSSLVDAARSQIPAEGRVLVGHCDDLSTPRLLGPFRDLIGSVGAALSRVLRDGADRDVTVAALHHELDWAGHPTLLAVEDVHWADDATLDVLRYFVRRIRDLPVVLLLTYRDDELTRDHRLRGVLGLAGTVAGTRRLPLQRLSADSVRALSAEVDVDPNEVFSVTGGNPFFVQEVLASAPGSSVPPTVVDAVLSRMRRLDPASVDAVERLCVITSTIDRQLVDALVPGGLSAVSSAEELGLLVVSPSRVAFRHELTRRAVADALPSARRTTLNANVLAVLESSEAPDLAQLVHHASEAGDNPAVVRHGPAAASAAATGGAHWEAAAHYRLVLTHRDDFPDAELADLLEASAIECYIVGDHDRNAVADQTESVALRRRLGDPVALGLSLRWLSRLRWWSGDRPGAEAAANECVAVLEPTGAKRELAWALSNKAQLAMLARHITDAVPTAERAVALAREVDDAEVLSHALNNLGTTLWSTGDPEGQPLVQEALEVALAAGKSEHAMRAYVNLIWQLMIFQRPREAERLLEPAIALAGQAEYLVFWKYLNVAKGMVALADARWEDALRDARVALDATDPIRCAGLTVVGLAGLRSGLPVNDEIDEVWRLAQKLDELQRTAPAAALVCEAAYLRGDMETIRDVAGPVFDEAVRLGARIECPELGYWLSIAGVNPDLDDLDHPYALMSRGYWQEAADAWATLGYPYEEALALAGSDDPAVVLDALARLDSLGAMPMARLVRNRLRSLGVAGVPRGPVASTRHNLAGLTPRQLEVLQLVAEELSNLEIADRMFVSVRTIDNHVAALLQKLKVRSRTDAVKRAVELGMVPK
ncbi:MAG: AAA family ATPase [Nocardioidaceae bacterium]